MTVGARDQERGVGGTGTRGAAWLAWSLVCLTLAMSTASGALFVLTRFGDVPGSSDAPGGGTAASAAVLLLFVSYLAFPVVGALIVSRRPRNPIGWICLGDGLLWALINMIQYYSTYGLAVPATRSRERSRPRDRRSGRRATRPDAERPLAGNPTSQVWRNSSRSRSHTR